MSLLLKIAVAVCLVLGNFDIAYAQTAEMESAQNIVASPAVPIASAGKVVAMLILVVGMIIGFGWLAKRVNLGHFSASDRMKVDASTMVGQKEKLILVRVDGQKLLLGVTPHGISTLHTFPPVASTHDKQHTKSCEQSATVVKNPDPENFSSRASATFSQYLEKVIKSGAKNES